MDRPKISSRIFLCVLFCGCGFFGNWFNISLFFNVDFLFGSVFSILAILTLGRVCGILTAFIAGSCTYLIWNHPWAVIIFTGEAFAVSWFYGEKKGNVVLYDLIYWIFIGMPLVYLFYHPVMGMSFPNTLLIMLKQSVNGVFNALLAILALSLYKSLKRPQNDRTAYSDLLSTAMISFAILPIILLSIYAIRAHQENRMETLRSQVTWVAEAAEKNLKEWIFRHHGNIQILSTLVGDPNQDSFEKMQHYVELIRTATPEFKGMGVFDNRSITVAYSPLEQDGISNLGVDMSARTHIDIMRKDRKPYITDILMSKLGISSPIVVFAAPVVLSGEYRGYCSGVLEIHQISGILENLKTPDTHITLVDGQNRVIVSTLQEFKTMDPFTRPYIRTNDDSPPRTLLWKPDPRPNISVMQQWAGSFLFHEIPVAGNGRWRVIAEASLLPVARATSQYCLTWLSFQGILIFAAILISTLLSNGLISNLKKLQIVTRSMPQTLHDRTQIEWPRSTVQELAELSDNFQEMTAALLRRFNEQKNAEKALRESLEEKTSLLKEVHHRVKNNLQIVSSLLGLQADRTDNRQALEVLQDTRNRVRSMALLHEALYRSGNLARINFSSYLKDLCRQLVYSLGNAAARVTLEFRVAPVEFPLEPALTCGLIVNELVSNAFKHGFPEGRRGSIFIGLEVLGEQRLLLKAADNGVGLPPNFDPASVSTLGMRLVTGLAAQMGGNLSFETPDGGGVSICVIFPLPKDTQIGGRS